MIPANFSPCPPLGAVLLPRSPALQAPNHLRPEPRLVRRQLRLAGLLASSPEASNAQGEQHAIPVAIPTKSRLTMNWAGASVSQSESWQLANVAGVFRRGH